MTKMSIHTFKEELNSLTDFQKEFHTTEHPKEKITSNFYQKFTKCTWYSNGLQRLKETSDGDEIVYTANNSLHFLMYSYLRDQTPTVRVKNKYIDKVKICWCHNLGINRIKKAYFREDEADYQTFENIGLDIYFQFFEEPGAGKRNSRLQGIGNVPFLEEWTEYLPSIPINFEQPWFYSNYSYTAFPLFLKDSTSRAEHRYIFRNYEDLLRIKILNKNDKWIELKSSSSVMRDLSEYLDFFYPKKSRVPELWANYAYVTEPEIEFFKECANLPPYYIRDMEVCDETNVNKFKSTGILNLSCSHPCLSLFWVAQNADAAAKRNFSNYTTNSESVYEGWDPIVTTSLKYGNDFKFENMESDHFNKGSSRKSFLSAPCEPGYHGYSYAKDPRNFDAEVGVALNRLNTSLICYLDDTNPFSNSNLRKYETVQKTDNELFSLTSSDSELSAESENTSFLLKARMYIVKKLTFEKLPDGRFTTIVI